MTNHDDEAVDKVCTLKKREECFSYSKVSHFCHLEIRIEKNKDTHNMKKEQEDNHLVRRPFFSCQIHLLKIQFDHNLYLESIRIETGKIMVHLSDNEKKHFFCFLSIVVLYK